MRRLVPFVCLSVLLSTDAAFATGYELGFASSMTRVPHRAVDFPSNGLTTAEIWMARNENEATQVVILATGTTLTGVSVSVTPLSRDGGGDAIAPSNITPRLVSYIQGNYNRPPTDYGMFVDPAAAQLGYSLWPDPLMELTGSFDVAAGEAQPIWLNVYTPPETLPGTYRGQVQIRATGEQTVTVTLIVHVWSFALPRETHLRSSFFIWDSGLSTYHNVSERSSQFLDIRQKYVDSYLKHRISPNTPAYYPLDMKFTLQPDNSITIDFTDFDARLQHAFDLGLTSFQWPASILHYLQANVMYVGGPFILDGSTPDPDDYVWIDMDTSWVNPDDPARDRLKALSVQIANHLQDRAWLSKVVAYMVGEPARGGHSYTPELDDYEYARRIFAWLHGVHPGIPNMVAMIGDQFTADIAADINVWAGDTSEQWKYVSAETVQRNSGDEIWTYLPGLFRIDNLAACYRLLPWYAWKYNVQGIGPFTDITAWFVVPYGLPLSWVSHQPGWPADDWIIYPGTNGPIETTRLELLRDGMDDYEYFWLANQLTHRLRATSPTSPLVSESDQLLFADQRVIHGRNPLNVGEWDVVNSSLSSVRLELGELIQRLRRAVPPDLDGDGDVDLADAGLLANCMSGAGIFVDRSPCNEADLDGDNDVDQSDFGLFQRCLSGSGVGATPYCAN
jgi:hypothetical protein